ncbi:MAG: threonylcarbamoyl-AMP synthase [Phycisphaerae bacterium]|nr:threonylcarbamoyl-AMP synthase [Phycisphaerae bacterium]
MDTRVIKVGSGKKAAAAAKAGARALKAGRLVGFATETVYGIGAVATKSAAIERLRELKSRPGRPFSVHIARPKDVSRYVRDIPADAARLIAKAWPGPVTLLLETGGRLADKKLHKAGLYETLCAEDVIGLRCPDNVVCSRMLAAVNEPVVAPSANRAGKASPRDADDVLKAFDGKIDLLIDSGPTRLGKDSTIVRFGPDGWKIVRKGIYDERMIHKFLQRRFIFVCTGNTCRSPIAAGLAKKFLAEKFDCTVGDLRARGIEIVSAGVFAASGAKPTPEAAYAARLLGADISRHRSRKLTTELINSADMVFCMTGFHVEEVRRLSPSVAKENVALLAKGEDIADPIGGEADVYRKTAGRIQRAVKSVCNKVIK